MRPFGEVLKEIVRNSDYSEEVFSEQVNQKINNSNNDNIAPSISTLDAVIKVGKPKIELERELYRSIIPLMLLDEERPINEIIYASRHSQGITLTNIGNKLDDMVDKPDECEIHLIVPLLELGYRRVLDNEIEAIAEILGIDNVDILKRKARPKDGLKVVDKDFNIEDLQLTDEKIDKATKFLEEDKNTNSQTIVNAASDYMNQYKSLKDDKSQEQQ